MTLTIFNAYNVKTIINAELDSAILQKSNIAESLANGLTKECVENVGNMGMPIYVHPGKYA